jgi:hypothetical protein
MKFGKLEIDMPQGRQGDVGGSVRRVVRIVLSLIALALMWGIGSNMIEVLDASEIMVVQSIFDGELTWHTAQGPKGQWLGKVTKYKKRDILPIKQSIRFNDNGHGTVIGSVQFELPLDKKNLNALHSKYGSQEAIKSQLVDTIVNKCIYLSGPLMSSKESSAEKRNDLIRFIEDQIEKGVYRTVQKDVQIPDPLNDKQMKVVTVVDIVKDEKGQLARQEAGALGEFGIRTYNFAIKDLPYDETVEKQIKEQQALAMQVTTSIAQAKQAEQKAITVEMEGKAEAAKAKWEQEVIKAKAVTQAQQEKEVASLQKDAAEFNRQKLILEGQGEAAKRAAIMSADGGLDKKIEAFKEIHFKYAEAIMNAKHPLTPTVMMGGNANGANIGTTLSDLLMTKTAMDLGLDFRMRSGAQITK